MVSCDGMTSGVSRDCAAGPPPNHLSGAAGVALHSSGNLLLTEHQLHRHVLPQLALFAGGGVHDRD